MQENKIRTAHVQQHLTRDDHVGLSDEEEIPEEDAFSDDNAFDDDELFGKSCDRELASLIV